MNDKKVLVTGGAGYIGDSVVDLLVEKNIPFTVYDSLLYEHHYLKQVDFIYGDIRDTEKLKKILKDYTHVIWLAAIVGDTACQIKPDLTMDVNQKSVDWLAKNYDGKIIFTSTCSVYGKNEGELNEESAVNPLSLYAQTKLGAEKNLAEKNALIFRLGTVFGASSHCRLRMDLVVNYMTANAVKKGKLTVFGGTQWRPLIHVRNVAEAIVNNLDKPNHGIYNLTTSNYQIKDLAKEVSEITGCKIEYTPSEFEDQRNYHVSAEKARSAGLLNFEKILTVKDGAAQIQELISSGRIKYSESDIYSNEKHIANLHQNGQFE
ncbi:NAD(P)-dependent oxidoreductase [Candidatus Wolfebacteria bacterium]|nr:NAD(P)-dependent oxidoreductase [Candidatus Wolfebacteria bacterium]